ncbi:MAG: RDD family protein [bacterium]|nr:RDD family protein [bacterium]
MKYYPTWLNKEHFNFFLRRIGARVVDIVILAIVGALLISFSPLSALGDWGLILGFLIVWFYEGILHSRIGKGQSVGKRLFRLVVVKSNGDYLSILDSFIRGLPFAIALVVFESKNVLSMFFPNLQFAFTLISMTLFLLFGFLSPLFILFRTPQQSFADLLVQSNTIEKKSLVKNENQVPIFFQFQLRKYQLFILSSFLVYSILLLAVSHLFYRKNVELVRLVNQSNTIVSHYQLPLHSFYLSPERTKDGKYILISRTRVDPEVPAQSGKTLGEAAAFTVWTELLKEFPDQFVKTIGAIHLKYGLNLGFSDGTTLYEFSYQ